MAEVEVYATKMCPFCWRAKQLLKSKGVAFTEIDVTADSTGRAAMQERAGGDHKVPQIFIDNAHVGGCDELMALDKQGKLDPLLAA